MDSGILYWFLSRTRDRNANNIAFNGSTTFAQSNDIVAKTAYNGTVSGNVTIGSDGDGSYFDINWNKNWGSWTNANILFWNVMWLTQATNFEFHIKFALMTNPPASLHSWIFWSNNDFTIGTFSTNRTIRLASKPTYSLYQTSAITLWVVYTVCVKYVASEWKAYLYLNWVLQNTWWSVMSTTFTCDAWSLWDLWCETTADSSRKKVYYARVYSTALTDEQRTAELALWQKNTARKDCVLEILPPYYAGTAGSPTTIYDVKAFSQYTPRVVSLTFKLNTDAVNTADSQTLFATPYFYTQIRDNTNTIQARYDPTAWAAISWYVIWNWDRNTHNLVCSYWFENWQTRVKVFLDWVKVDDDLRVFVDSIAQYGNTIQIWKRWTAVVFNWTISNIKVFIWTITDTEGVAMSSWIPVIPVNATLFTQPRRLPPYWTAMTDVSGNWYDFTLTP